MNLNELGWHPFFESCFDQYKPDGLVPARVSCEQKGLYQVIGEGGEFRAEVTGRMMHRARSRADFPVVGDWVAVEPRINEGRATITAVLPRRSSFSRKAVLSGGNPDGGGKTDEQLLATNVDTVFLVSGLDGDFNPRRIERYVTVAWDSGAVPVIILNKVDLCEDIDQRIEQVGEVAFGVPVHPVSATTKEGFEDFDEYLSIGRTVVFLGSSGVGKSTIINTLFGSERMKTKALREDDSRGRHTTTNRELIVLPGRGVVIDTPGMREIAAYSDEEGLGRTFGDIEVLASSCRFVDCGHNGEPGCAVQEALADGTLDTGRYNNYIKLLKEQASLTLRKDQKAYRQATREWGKKVRRYHQGVKDLKKKGLL
ncbi:MAG: ribosome small subunit-dependent GTPase A [FCB group bacterium]|nr:ribosome small subunit-dependent GTPase A [FCB group bacterium]